MTRLHSVRLLQAAAVLMLVGARPLHAQGLAGRVALEAIASVSTQQRAIDDPSVILDLVSTVRLADGWDVVLRPWSMRRPGGDWMFEMYQLQVRYVSSTRAPFRFDAGNLPSPVGLFTLELQPHRNPLISTPSYYFAPLPAVDGQFTGVAAVARGFNVQVAQTLSPRIFAAARATRVTSPVVTVPAEVRRSSTAFEATLGYRLTTEFTVRGGYQRERGYRDTD